MMFGWSYKIARVWGIPIKIHISLVILAVLIGLKVARSGSIEAVGFALLFIVCLFTSIALHELGHSFIALRKQCRVREITLMFMGGVAQMERIPTKPLDEFLMALAGPAVSLAIGLSCYFGGIYLNSHVEGMQMAFELLALLGIANLLLAGFNLLPGFPMDGGRVLRAILTTKLGRLRATHVAARIGQTVAVLLGIAGLSGGIPWLAPERYWILVAIAFFLFTSAGNEYRLVQRQETLRQSQTSSWPPFDGEWHSNTDDDRDEVVISPPPYSDKADSKTEIRRADRRDPFA